MQDHLQPLELEEAAQDDVDSVSAAVVPAAASAKVNRKKKRKNCGEKNGSAGPPRKKYRYKGDMVKAFGSKPANLLTDNPELFAVKARGGVEFLYCSRQDGSEGFLHPFFLQYFTTKEDEGTKKAVKELFQKTKIIAVVGRRLSKEVNDYELKEVDGKFKKAYFVRFCKNDMTGSGTKVALEEIAKVSCHW